MLAACDPPNARFETSDRRHIVNGTLTGYDSWQSAVMVRTSQVLCTGTLIHPSVVLTAAHCIYSEDLENDDRNHPERLSITGGDRGDDAMADVVEIAIHPAWKGVISNDASDLALLALTQPITEISSVKLRDYPSPSVGDDAVVVGYGDDPFDDRVGTFHREGETKLLRISPYFMEIGGETNTCTGDSGGPLFTRQNGEWVLTGVTSYGVDTCDAEAEGYSVNLLSYCGWLNDTMMSLVGEDLGLKNCTGCDAASVHTWGQPCGPGYACCPTGTQCRTPEEFSTGGLGYCAPSCCNLGQRDVGYCTNVTQGEESCLFTAEFESAFCAISCDDDSDCAKGTVCKNRKFASDKICIAEVTGTGADCDPNDTDGASVDPVDTATAPAASETPQAEVKADSSGGCQFSPVSNRRGMVGGLLSRLFL